MSNPHLHWQDFLESLSGRTKMGFTSAVSAALASDGVGQGSFRHGAAVMVGKKIKDVIQKESTIV